MKGLTRREMMAVGGISGAIPMASLFGSIHMPTAQDPKAPRVGKVDDLLARISPENGLLKVGEMVIELAERDETTQRALHALQDRVLSSITSEQTIGQYGRIVGPAADKRRFDDDAFPGMTTLAASIYLLATEGIRTSGLPTPEDLRSAILRSEQRVRQLGEDFFAQLTLTAERIAQSRHSFAHQIDGAADTIASLYNSLARQVERYDGLAPPKPDNRLFAGKGWIVRFIVDGEVVSEKEIPCWLAWLFIVGLITLAILLL